MFRSTMAGSLATVRLKFRICMMLSLVLMTPSHWRTKTHQDLPANLPNPSHFAKQSPDDRIMSIPFQSMGPGMNQHGPSARPSLSTGIRISGPWHCCSGSWGNLCLLEVSLWYEIFRKEKLGQHAIWWIWFASAQWIKISSINLNPSCSHTAIEL